MTDDLRTDDPRSDDVERALRAMLTQRAGDIRTVPEAVLTLDESPAGDDPDGAEPGEVGEVLELGAFRHELLASARRRWPLLLAAAVVLAVLGGVLTALVTRPVHHQPATDHHPHLQTVVRSACRSSVPASWGAVLTGATSDVPGLDSGSVLAVTYDGGAVVQEQPVYGSADHARLGYLAPSATRVHWLGAIEYVPPSHRPYPRGSATSFGLDVDVSGHTAVVTIEAGTHAVPGALVPAPRKVVALDLLSGEQKVLLSPPGSSRMKITGQAYAFGPTAYVQLTPRKRVRGVNLHDEILAIPLDGGRPEVVAHGLDYVDKSALGVEWNLEDGPIDRPARVPAVVARHALSDSNDDFESFITDGRDYAWQTQQGDLDWYNAATNTLVRIPQLLGVPGVSPGQATLYTVAGPLVFYQNRYGTADRIVDTRTGAVVPASNTGQLFAARGRFVGDPRAFGIPAFTSAGNIVRVAGDDLPAVHC